MILLILSLLLVSCSPVANHIPTSIPSPAPSSTLTPIPTFTSTIVPTSTGTNALSQVDPASLLFEQNFDNGKQDGISFSPQYWETDQDDNGNEFLCSIPGNTYAGLNFGQSSWTNYAVELRFKELDHQPGLGSTVAIYFRYDPSTNTGDAGLLDIDSHYADLILNKPSENLSHSYYSTLKDAWYTMRVELAGQNIKFFINNQWVGSGTDSTFIYGAANISVSPYEKICVDDIRVWALDENGNIASATTPDPTLVATLENNPQDIYPEVWSQISPTGQSYEYKVNCGGNYSKLETCFLWNIDQVIVTSPSGNRYYLKKDFNVNTYSGEVTRRWVLYGPNGAGLPENGQYTFTYIKNKETVFVQTVSFTQGILAIPTHVVVSQIGNNLHVAWQPPEGITSDMGYKVIVFDKATGQFATSLSFPPSSTDAVLPAPPLTPGAYYFLNVAIYWSTGYAYSENITFKWNSP
jgi:hypothetical protein